MKNILKLGFIFTMLFTNSCSKDEENIVEENKTTANLYSNSPNLSDGIQAEVFIPSENSSVFFYGDFDNLGIPNAQKSIAIKTGNEILNVIFDDNFRVKLSYKSHSDGTKENYIIKYDYPSNNLIQVSFYEYNWANNTDKLLYQNIVNDSNEVLTGNVTYAGKSLNSNNFFSIDNRIKLKNAIKKAGEVVSFALGAGATIAVPVVVIAAVNAGVFGIPIASAIIIAEIAFLALPSNANEIKQNFNTNYPTSPTSGTIPNTTGTPTNPIGLQLFINSKWKIQFITNNCQGNSNLYSEEMNNKEILISNYFQSNGDDYFSFSSISGCYNSTAGSWLLYENGNVTVHIEGMCSGGLYPDKFNFNSVGYNRTEKYYDGTFNFESGGSGNPNFISNCTGSMKLIKIN